MFEFLFSFFSCLSMIAVTLGAIADFGLCFLG
jgi:hypothetical protein